MSINRYCGELKQSTTVTIQIGPFIDDTDFQTEETALALTQADIQLSKANSVFAQKNDANAATADALGYYRVQIDTTDTNTLGRLIVAIHEAGALPVTQEYTVVPDQKDGTDGREVFIGWLKQSAAREITVGPFIDLTTREPRTAVIAPGNITATLMKDGTPPTATALTLTASGGSNDFSHLSAGIFRLELTASNLDTLGPGSLQLEDADLFYGPITYRWIVVPDHVYDGLIADSDKLKVDTVQWLSTAVTLSTNNFPDVNVHEISDDLASASNLEAALVTAAQPYIHANVWAVSEDLAAAVNLETALDGGSYNVGGGGIQADMTKISGDSVAADRLEAQMDGCPVYTVVVGAAPSTTTFECDSTEATADHYKDRYVLFITGVNAEQHKACTAYNGGTKVLTCDAFTGAPGAGDQFILY